MPKGGLITVKSSWALLLGWRCSSKQSKDGKTLSKEKQKDSFSSHFGFFFFLSNPFVQRSSVRQNAVVLHPFSYKEEEGSPASAKRV